MVRLEIKLNSTGDHAAGRPVAVIEAAGCDAAADYIRVEAFVAGEGDQVLPAHEDPGVADARFAQEVPGEDIADLQISGPDVAGVLEPAGGLGGIVDRHGRIVPLIHGQARVFAI